MKPVEFEEQNCMFAEHQEEYLNLPVFKDEEGMVISCWELSWKERIQLFFTGKVWVTILTFNKSLQPLSLQVQKPSVKHS